MSKKTLIQKARNRLVQSKQRFFKKWQNQDVKSCSSKDEHIILLLSGICFHKVELLGIVTNVLLSLRSASFHWWDKLSSHLFLNHDILRMELQNDIKLHQGYSHGSQSIQNILEDIGHPLELPVLLRVTLPSADRIVGSDKIRIMVDMAIMRLRMLHDLDIAAVRIANHNHRFLVHTVLLPTTDDAL